MSLVRLDADGEQTQEGGLDNTADAEAPTTETIAESQGDPWARGQNHSKPAANDAESRYWASLNAAAQERAQALQIENWGNGTTGQATGTTGQTELCRVYYFHTDQVGMPQELSNSQGQLVWQASYKTWGSTVAEEWEIKSLSGNAVHQLDRGDSPQAEDERQQNLRFQGQYLDRETRLHYNTFRYYDADIGRFICPDPIGLYGGHNLAKFAANPIIWIDPLGLSDDKYVVIGEGQASVDEAARILRNQGINAESMMHPKSQWRGGRLYDGMPTAEFEKAVQWNKEWLKQKINDGFKVIDIGSDGRTESSKFYLAELAALKETKTPKITLKMFSSGEIISAMRARLKAAC